MADDRNRPNDPRARPGPADSDTLNLLRDLRSLRDAVPTPVMKQVTEPEPGPPVGPNRRVVGVAIALILLVVGLGVRSVMNNPTDVVKASPSPGSSPSPESSASAASTVSASASSGPDSLQAVTSVAEIGLRHTLCHWLLRYYDTHAPVGLRFALLSDAAIIPVSQGPALMFGRMRLANEDELVLVEKSLEPTSGPKRRALLDWLVKSTTPGANPMEYAFGALATDDTNLALALLAAVPAGTEHRESAVFMASCLGGNDPAAAVKVLESSTEPLAFVLRAYQAAAMNQSDKAGTLLGQAATKSLSPAESFLAAGLAYRLAKTDQVEALLSKIPIAARESPAAFYARGLAAQKAGSWSKARELYTHASEPAWTEPSLAAAALVHRAIVNLEEDRIAQASTDLNAAEDKDAKSAQLVFARARAALAEQRFPDACTLWERNMATNGVTVANVTGLLRCFEKLTDQATSRHAYTLLPEVESSGGNLPAPLRQRLTKMVAGLRERFTPKPQPEESPR